MAATSDAIVPRITTERLLLRELRLGDFDRYAANLADPLATRFTSGVVDRRGAWRIFTALSGTWILNGAGWWAVEIRGTGDFIGTVGAFFREPGTALGTEADLELGWTLFPAFWRRGFATEAARAALAHGFTHHDVRRAIAHIDPANAASIGVSKAIGMTLEGEVDFYGLPTVRYTVTRRRSDTR